MANNLEAGLFFLFWDFYCAVNFPAENLIQILVKYVFWWIYFERMNECMKKNSQHLFKSKFTRNFALNLLKAIIRPEKGQL